MEDKKGIRQIPLGVLVALATVVLASGGATAWFTWRALNPVKPPAAEFPPLEAPVDPAAGSGPSDMAQDKPVAQPTTPTQSDNKQPDSPDAPSAVTNQIFWVKDVGGNLSLVPQAIALPAGNAEETVEAAFATLLTKSGDPQQDAFSTIPEKTRLLALTVEADGVHVNLSQEFTSGGGSASMIGRLGQVVYTATTLESEAGVWVSVEGKPLTLLGGEGLEVSQPMTRSEFKEAFGVGL